MRALTAHRQPAAMADPTIGPDVHQPLDVHRGLGAEGALDLVGALDLRAEPRDVGVAQITDALRGVHARRLEDRLRSGAADPEDVSEPDLDLLVAREIYAGNTCHI